MPDLNNDQFRTVYHASYDAAPPHTVDVHPAFADEDRETLSEWKNREADAMFAGTVESAADRAMTGRSYIHRYRVPKTSLSEELYGDDHMYAEPNNRAEINRAIYAKGNQPELWQTTPVTKKEAVNRGSVLRYTNMFEDPGKESVVIPKSAMKDKGVEFLGTDEITKDNLLDDYVKSENSKMRAAQPKSDPKFDQKLASLAIASAERSNRMETNRNNRNQLKLFDMPIDANSVSVLD